MPVVKDVGFDTDENGIYDRQDDDDNDGFLDVDDPCPLALICGEVSIEQLVLDQLVTTVYEGDPETGAVLYSKFGIMDSGPPTALRSISLSSPISFLWSGVVNLSAPFHGKVLPPAISQYQRDSMNQWAVLGTADIPNDGGQLKLSQRGQEFSIRLSGMRGDLMNSREHGSEEALAELGCARLNAVDHARVLVGGLGMGFTLAAALKLLSPSAQVTVAELIPAVVEWNRGPLGGCAGQPLDDERTRVHIGDVVHLLADSKLSFDAILLDVDNGPEGLTLSDNDWLYSADGLCALYSALRAEGTLAIWSAGPDPLFLIRLKKCGFHALARTVRARPGKGSRHTIFLAQKGAAKIRVLTS
jgi:hypothetical protein